MRILDAYTGRTVELGDRIPYPGAGRWWQLMEVDEGLLSARVLVRWDNGDVRWMPLQVRWTHPSFFLRKVGFFPS